MALPKKTLYQILGVSQDATAIDIGLAHEKKAAEAAGAMPPDPSAVALVQQAYEILSNPHRRAAYAASLVTAADVMLSFPLEAARGRAGLDVSRPNLTAWLARIHARPAYQRALERGRPYAYA